MGMVFYLKDKVLYIVPKLAYRLIRATGDIDLLVDEKDKEALKLELNQIGYP